jgi:hypothetical protein
MEFLRAQKEGGCMALIRVGDLCMLRKKVQGYEIGHVCKVLTVDPMIHTSIGIIKPALFATYFVLLKKKAPPQLSLPEE